VFDGLSCLVPFIVAAVSRDFPSGPAKARLSWVTCIETARRAFVAPRSSNLRFPLPHSLLPITPSHFRPGIIAHIARYAPRRGLFLARGAHLRPSLASKLNLLSSACQQRIQRATSSQNIATLLAFKNSAYTLSIRHHYYVFIGRRCSPL